MKPAQTEHPYASRPRPSVEDKQILPMTGEQVKHYRAVMGLSQNQLAVLLGVDPATTWRWDKVGISEHKVLMCLYYFAQHGPITLADVERVDGWMYSELQMEGVP